MHGTRCAVDSRELFEAGQVVESSIGLVNTIVELAMKLDNLCVDLARSLSSSPENKPGGGDGHEKHDGDQSQ